MNILTWFQKRGPGFVYQRARKLFSRYGISPDKAIRRIDRLMERLALYDCAPTFPVPGMVVKRHARYIHSLQDRGAEIAVHGYNHIDMKECDPVVANQQLARAVKVFKENEIEVHGFRSPYLSCNDRIIEILPEGMFNYSSNQAVRWDIVQSTRKGDETDLFRTIIKFYIPQDASTIRCVPYFRKGVVELPVSVPDDLQLRDGMNYCEEELSNAWIDLLDLTYKQGELFNLMFHPELAAECTLPFTELFKHAKKYYPEVWFARLCDIAGWWREKIWLGAGVTSLQDGIRLELPGSPRATWLVRGMEIPETIQWDGKYQRITSNVVQIHADMRPIIGVDGSVPTILVKQLRNLGYILDMTDEAEKCSILLDNEFLRSFKTESEIINWIEESDLPLIRLWPWPDGKRSALCITGDLDALSLIDYMERLFV